MHYGKSLVSVFEEFFASIKKFFDFGGETMPWASLGWAILWGLDTFLMFPNFLRSQVLICLVTREATRIYHVHK